MPALHLLLLTSLFAHIVSFHSSSLTVAILVVASSSCLDFIRHRLIRRRSLCLLMLMPLFAHVISSHSSSLTVASSSTLCLRRSIVHFVCSCCPRRLFVCRSLCLLMLMPLFAHVVSSHSSSLTVAILVVVSSSCLDFIRHRLIHRRSLCLLMLMPALHLSSLTLFAHADARSAFVVVDFFVCSCCLVSFVVVDRSVLVNSLFAP